MTGEESTPTPDEERVTWGSIRRALTRPYRVTASMVVLVLLVPFYLVIAAQARDGAAHVPHLAWDDLFPVIPEWSLVYGALYLFLIVLPVLVVQQEAMIRSTVRAYLAVWSLSYVCFALYPTVAPRPDEFVGSGFAAWGLTFLYDADPPYNCFPSLHVAHSFVSALACYCVHRRLGFFAIGCASLVALSTLFTKQHYVADVVVGVTLAVAACAVFLRGHARASAPVSHHRVAPGLALVAGGIVGVVFAVLSVAYAMGVTPADLSNVGALGESREPMRPEMATSAPEQRGGSPVQGASLALADLWSRPK